PGGQGGAEVTAKDDPDRTLELHQPGVGKADHRDGNGAGGLQQGGKQGAGRQPAYSTGSPARQQLFQRFASRQAKAFGNQPHAQQEQANASKTCGDIIHQMPTGCAPTTGTSMTS